MFNKEQLREHAKAASATIAAVGNFVSRMQYQNGRPADSVAQYDSIVAQCEQNNININGLVPKSLTGLIELFKDSPSAKNQILDSISRGIELYRNTHGGNMPTNAAIAAALDAGHLIYSGLNSTNTDGIFDSANARSVNPEVRSFYDSVSANSSGHIADVPALAMVTITMMIASSSPLVAYLPNPNGTNTLPLVYVRQIAGRDYGQTRKGEFLDGVKASAQYFDAIHKFKMVTADNKTFTLTTKRIVDANLAPQGNDRLPAIVGASRVYLNGVYVGNDEYSLGKTPQVSNFFPAGVEVNIDGVAYKLKGGTHNSATDTFSIEFETALPADAEVTIQVVADYQRKDGNGNVILQAPNADIDLDYASVHAYPIRAVYHATIEALTQMQNELGVDMRSAFIAIVIAKLMLEQNVRLLKEISGRAKGLGYSRKCDLSRGSDMTQAFNSSAMIGAEIFPAVEDCKRRIVTRTNHKPDGFDIYCTGSLSTLMKILADDTNFVPSGLTFGIPTEITRLGSKGQDNYYYVPESAGVVAEGEIDVNGTAVQYGEMLIIGRNSVAAKAVFVGHTAVPVITKDVTSEDFVQGVYYTSRGAAQVNEIARYSDQVEILKVMNLPASLTVAN
ncbi:hypothetical protein ACT426_18560 (plasmid) [Acinetobacter baumannii]